MKEIEKKNDLKVEHDTEILEKLYGKSDELGVNDKFLLDYIMNERWKGGNIDGNFVGDHYTAYQQRVADKVARVDKEDEDRDSEMDRFEAEFNFKHEDKDAGYLKTFPRQAPEDSMRRVDDKRKLAREQAKERKEEEKQKKKDEINRLKALKRDEIIYKLKKAEFLAGNIKSAEGTEGSKLNMGFMSDKKLYEKAEKELNTAFIPDLYDKTMDQLFGDKYYETKDVDGDNLEKTKDIDFKLMND